MLIGPRHHHKCSLKYPIGQLADILLPPYSRQVPSLINNYILEKWWYPMHNWVIYSKLKTQLTGRSVSDVSALRSSSFSSDAECGRRSVCSQPWSWASHGSPPPPWPSPLLPARLPPCKWSGQAYFHLLTTYGRLWRHSSLWWRHRYFCFLSGEHSASMCHWWWVWMYLHC